MQMWLNHVRVYHIKLTNLAYVYNLKVQKVTLFFSGTTMAARLLAEVASSHSRDPGFESPYALEARAKVGFLTKPIMDFPVCFLTPCTCGLT